MFRTVAFTASTLALLGTVALAAGHEGPHARAIAARKAHMQLYQHNLMILGSMARGNAEYDAGAAQGAADNLVALTQLNQAGYWPAGSDSFSTDGTRALPELWDNFPDVMAKGGALAQAAASAQAGASNGLEAVQTAMAELGGACNACHKSYRQPQ